MYGSVQATNVGLRADWPCERQRIQAFDNTTNYTQCVLCGVPIGVIGQSGFGFDRVECSKCRREGEQRYEAYSAEAQALRATGRIVWDVDSDTHSWSEEASQIAGFEPGAGLTTKMFLDRVHLNNRARLWRVFEQARKSAQNFGTELPLVSSAGGVKHLRIGMRRVRYKTGKEEFVGAVIDLTDAKRSQEALEVTRAALDRSNRIATLGEISATIVHEVNQPLAAININAETCLRRLSVMTTDLDKIRETIEWILRDARRAAKVIRGVQDFARKADTSKAPLDLNELVIATSAILSPELAARHVKFCLALAPRIPLIEGNWIQLQQVIVNLIMNGADAIRRMPQSESRLVISTALDESCGVVVSVKDNGAGIADDAGPKIFDAFFSTKPQGLGMGLSICRSIIEEHGGLIFAKNNIGELGATFEVCLPLVQIEGYNRPSPNGK